MGKSYKRGRFGSSNIGIRLSAKPGFSLPQFGPAEITRESRAETEIVAGVCEVERRSGYLSTEKLL